MYRPRCLINETAARAFGWINPEEAVGKRLTLVDWEKQGVVVGVVKDFHFLSLHHAIEPLVMHLQTHVMNLSMRVRTTDLPETAAGKASVLRLPKEEIGELVGFDFHRGVLACAKRPAPVRWSEWMTKNPLSEDATVAVCAVTSATGPISQASRSTVWIAWFISAPPPSNFQVPRHAPLS